jgi:hypothetical protein
MAISFDHAPRLEFVDHYTVHDCGASVSFQLSLASMPSVLGRLQLGFPLHLISMARSY